MNLNIRTIDIKQKLRRNRDKLYLPGVTTLSSIITASILLSVIPGSTVTNWVITWDYSPIVEAGGLAQPVVGFFQFGVARIYVPLFSLLLIFFGELASLLLSRFKLPVAILAGVGSGIQPVVVIGCGCGRTAGRTMSLLEQAITTGLF
jgi:hypothetical protein